jgi:hypothetical protein
MSVRELLGGVLTTGTSRVDYFVRTTGTTTGGRVTVQRSRRKIRIGLVLDCVER